ncbi:MAG: hypothetical protein KF817_01810 [Phycisphaeraceae bacterium]|nr:hypothetical protein [Phycisphaeraceae bacterium]
MNRRRPRHAARADLRPTPDPLELARRIDRAPDMTVQVMQRLGYRLAPSHEARRRERARAVVRGGVTLLFVCTLALSVHLQSAREDLRTPADQTISDAVGRDLRSAEEGLRESLRAIRSLSLLGGSASALAPGARFTGSVLANAAIDTPGSLSPVDPVGGGAGDANGSSAGAGGGAFTMASGPGAVPLRLGPDGEPVFEPGMAVPDGALHALPASVDSASSVSGGGTPRSPGAPANSGRGAEADLQQIERSGLGPIATLPVNGGLLPS